jgi:uncharacterized protein YndB with AHSA1/START domain
MPDILQDFPIQAPLDRVFEAVSDPRLLTQWWTLRSSGAPREGEEYVLDFGPAYIWRATVTRCTPNRTFELQITNADPDWTGTLLGFELSAAGGGTHVRFYHRGWSESNDHYRISNHCWAMYLRILRRFLEFGESVPYEKRLIV